MCQLTAPQRWIPAFAGMSGDGCNGRDKPGHDEIEAAILRGYNVTRFPSSAAQ